MNKLTSNYHKEIILGKLIKWSPLCICRSHLENKSFVKYLCKLDYYISVIFIFTYILSQILIFLLVCILFLCPDFSKSKLINVKQLILKKTHQDIKIYFQNKIKKKTKCPFSSTKQKHPLKFTPYFFTCNVVNILMIYHFTKYLGLLFIFN